jgi:hypothetical protein
MNLRLINIIQIMLKIVKWFYIISGSSVVIFNLFSIKLNIEDQFPNMYPIHISQKVNSVTSYNGIIVEIDGFFGEVWIKNADGVTEFINMLSLVFLCFLIVLFCNVFINLLESLKQRIPFSIQNAVNMLNTGYIFILTSLPFSFLFYWLQLRIQDGLTSSDFIITPQFDFDFPALFLGFFFVLLGNILKMGIVIQQENELTV